MPFDSIKELLVHKYSDSAIVLTDAWCPDGHELLEGEMLQGELSEKHIGDANNVFTFICRSAEARDGRWCEYIGDIYAVKESEFSLDEFASLLVYIHFEGSSFGIDIWYRFDPVGKVTKVVQNPLHLELVKARFI